MSDIQKILGFGSLGIGLASLSDPDLKTNIRKMGQSGKLNLYTWQWNDIARKVFGVVGYGMGVMADEVERLYPEKVIRVKGFRYILPGVV